MKKHAALALAVMLVRLALAQIELKDAGGYGEKEFRKAPKRIYIAQFRVNYQLLYTQEDVDKGGRTLGGGQRGTVKSSLTLGVKGVEGNDLQEITDRLYKSFTDKLQQAGYELISADETQGIKAFEGWERKKGGTLNLAQYPGCITATPTGFEYFVKKTKDSGKEKGTFTDNSLKISNDIKAVVAKINIAVPFVEDAESTGSKMLSDAVAGLTKVVLRPYLRIEKDPVVATGTFSSDYTQTQVTYAFMQGMGTQGITHLQLKKNIEIPGIFEDKKYKAVETADYDWRGTSIGALTIFNIADRELAMMQPVSCDGAQYKEKVYQAAIQYLDATLEKFLGFTKK